MARTKKTPSNYRTCDDLRIVLAKRGRNDYALVPSQVDERELSEDKHKGIRREERALR